MNFLKGKKTYLVVAVGVLVNGLVAMGIIPESSLELVNTLLVFLGLGTIRHGVGAKEVEATK